MYTGWEFPIPVSHQRKTTTGNRITNGKLKPRPNASSETQRFKGDGKGRERLGAGKTEGGREGKEKGKGQTMKNLRCLI